MVIKAGLLSRLVSLLENDDLNSELQLEAARALKCITSGNLDEIKAVVDANACPQLIRLLKSSSREDVLEDCAWALGNIAKASVPLRDKLLQMGILPALFMIFDNETSRISTKTMSKRTFSNLLKRKPSPSIENIASALPYISKLVYSNDRKTVSDACWTLSFICDSTNDRIQMVLDQNEVPPKLIELLSSEISFLQKAALRIVGNIVSGDNLQTQALIDLGILPVLTPLLSHKEKDIRKVTCWAISNITAGTKAQIDAVIQCDGLIAKLIETLKSDDLYIQKEATWAIRNVTSRGTNEQIILISMAGAVTPLCSMLSSLDNKIVNIVLEGLANILMAAKKHGESSNKDTLSKVVEELRTSGGITTIKTLQQHKSLDILIRAAEMIENFFHCDPRSTQELITFDAFEKNKTHLLSDDIVLVHKAVQNIRRILSIEENPLIQMVIKAGVLSRLVSLLENFDHYPEIQFKAAWALANISSGNSDTTKAVVDANACPQLIRLLSSSKSEDVLEHCAWALGNVAENCVPFRDMLLQLDILPALFVIFNNEKNRISTIRSSMWILSNLFREKTLTPSIENVTLVLPYISKLMYSNDIEIVSDACWALCYISDGTND